MTMNAEWERKTRKAAPQSNQDHASAFFAKFAARIPQRTIEGYEAGLDGMADHGAVDAIEREGT